MRIFIFLEKKLNKIKILRPGKIIGISEVDFCKTWIIFALRSCGSSSVAMVNSGECN